MVMTSEDSGTSAQSLSLALTSLEARFLAFFRDRHGLGMSSSGSGLIIDLIWAGLRSGVYVITRKVSYGLGSGSFSLISSCL